MDRLLLEFEFGFWLKKKVKWGELKFFDEDIEEEEENKDDDEDECL